MASSPRKYIGDFRTDAHFIKTERTQPFITAGVLELFFEIT